MTQSLTEIICTKCGNKFQGVLNELFDIAQTYSANCPECNAQSFFEGSVPIVDGPIPGDAVKIMYVAKL